MPERAEGRRIPGRRAVREARSYHTSPKHAGSGVALVEVAIEASAHPLPARAHWGLHSGALRATDLHITNSNEPRRLRSDWPAPHPLL